MDLPSLHTAPVLGQEPPQDRAPEPVARPAGDLAEGIHEARLCALIYENRRERPRRSAII